MLSVLTLLLCSQGYLGLGFPTNPGNMVPADAVIATIDDKTATTSVSAAV
jgi:hypothetical protein